MDKIGEEKVHDVLYAIRTELLNNDVSDLLKVSEGRWQIENCFKTMKTNFEAQPI